MHRGDRVSGPLEHVQGRIVQHEIIRRRSATDDGLTLIEMMVALLVLGITLSAFAGVIMASFRAISTSEREVRATSLAQQVIEELQSVTWDAAGLYMDEVGAAPDEWNSGNTATFDGNELVLLPDADAGARLAQVPLPRDTVDIGNVLYTVNRYVTWIDSDGDGTTDTKRFTAVVTWPSLNGSERSLTSVGERVPTQAESPATALGARVLALTGAPDPAELFPLGSDPLVVDKNIKDLVFTIRLNQSVLASPTPTLRFYSLGDDPQATAADEEYIERSVTAVSSEGDTRWDATIPAETYRFANGALEVLFTAQDLDGNWIETFGSIRLFNGSLEHDGEAPRPAAMFETGLFPKPPTQTTTDPVGVENPVLITGVIAISSPICVNKSTWKLSKDIELTINAKGLVENDGTVTVTYKNWPSKTASPVLVTDSAIFQSGSIEESVYRLSVAKQAERLFPPDDPEISITFTVKGTRSDGSNDTEELIGVSVSSC